jgi:hypothetical protein
VLKFENIYFSIKKFEKGDPWGKIEKKRLLLHRIKESEAKVWE